MNDWISAARRLPECDGETVFVGINTNGYACCFNAMDSRGNCVMDSPEYSVTQMSCLKYWMQLRPPAVEEKREAK